MKKEWEVKVIETNRLICGDFMVDKFSDSNMEYIRNWLLGGENFEWEAKRDLTTGNLILKRR